MQTEAQRTLGAARGRRRDLSGAVVCKGAVSRRTAIPEQVASFRLPCGRRETWFELKKVCPGDEVTTRGPSLYTPSAGPSRSLSGQLALFLWPLPSGSDPLPSIPGRLPELSAPPREPPPCSSHPLLHLDSDAQLHHLQVAPCLELKPRRAAPRTASLRH